MRFSLKSFALLTLFGVCGIGTRQASATPESGEKAVRTALALQGTRYRYAGMSSRGVDCSGFIARVLSAHGIRAPHSSQALSKMGKAVPPPQLEAGDLVFFRTRGWRISHVGMYIGDGKFIHASSHARRVVVDRLNSDYYLRRFVCARRLF